MNTNDLNTALYEKMAAEQDKYCLLYTSMWFINSRKPLTCYGWRFYDSDQVKIDTFLSLIHI